MEGFSHLGSLIVVDPRVDQALADELHEITAGLGAHTGISLTAAVLGTAGLVLRSLSNSTEELQRVAGSRHRPAAQALVRPGSAGSEEVLMAGTQQRAAQPGFGR